MNHTEGYRKKEEKNEEMSAVCWLDTVMLNSREKHI